MKTELLHRIGDGIEVIKEGRLEDEQEDTFRANRQKLVNSARKNVFALVEAEFSQEDGNKIKPKVNIPATKA